MNAAWELDLWGRIRRLNEEAKAQYLATEEARRGVPLSLISDVAETYFQLRELDALLIIARNTASQLPGHLRPLQAPAGGRRGLGDRDLPGRGGAGQRAGDHPRARTPDRGPRKPDQPAARAEAPAPFPAGSSWSPSPSRRRSRRGFRRPCSCGGPTSGSAEQQLIAANANVGANIAATFPDDQPDRPLRRRQPGAQQVLRGGEDLDVAAGLLGPLFQGGRLRKNVAIAKAQFQQALILYEQAVNNAFGEVSTQLAAWQKLAESEREVAREVHAYQESVRLANVRYLSGLSSYVEVLDAMNLLFPAENNLAQVRLQRLVALAEFYKALGGGWQVEEAQAAAADSADNAKSSASRQNVATTARLPRWEPGRPTFRRVTWPASASDSP